MCHWWTGDCCDYDVRTMAWEKQQKLLHRALKAEQAQLSLPALLRKSLILTQHPLSHTNLPLSKKQHRRMELDCSERVSGQQFQELIQGLLGIPVLQFSPTCLFYYPSHTYCIDPFYLLLFLLYPFRKLQQK